MENILEKIENSLGIVMGIVIEIIFIILMLIPPYNLAETISSVGTLTVYAIIPALVMIFFDSFEEKKESEFAVSMLMVFIVTNIVILIVLSLIQAGFVQIIHGTLVFISGLVTIFIVGWIVSKITGEDMFN